ncbi:hypothetical protein Cgig2_008891 [Carnegiea gigantea]|uniref:Uncharacterized protein n=1 Tax=Carnegiea gigantea TaxID=171969 RepID=A0A9Q1KL61_9CARY|nr:hypothetical protein Cgig2_008891 [Carnegiea gigantea]
MASIPPPSCFGISISSADPVTPPPHSGVCTQLLLRRFHLLRCQILYLLCNPLFYLLLASLLQKLILHATLFTSTIFPIFLMPIQTFLSMTLMVMLMCLHHLLSSFHTLSLRWDPPVIRLPAQTRRCPVPSSDLVHYTLLGPGREYEALVTTLTHLPLQLSFNDLRPQLLIQEQWLRHLCELDDDSVVHTALAAFSTNATGYNSNNRYKRKGKGESAKTTKSP